MQSAKPDWLPDICTNLALQHRFQSFFFHKIALKEVTGEFISAHAINETRLVARYLYKSGSAQSVSIRKQRGLQLAVNKVTSRNHADEMKP
mmetsp:Transcript_98730/g.171046  ORF Transcript_98730/g.171046 Transcript_98730/m.171046 type:complete len:91 (-) Transcript_98730:3224-3496(-)